MNEHEPINNDQAPDTRTSDDLDPKLLDAALDAMRRYEASGRGHGEAFFAYLQLRPDLPDHIDEEEDFRERFVGRYADRWSLIRDRLDHFGWSQAAATFKAEQGMWPDDLNWDQGVLWEHFTELYSVVERSGGIYVFES